MEIFSKVVKGRGLVLFIGGTGIISSGCAECAVETGWEVYLLNRGHTESIKGTTHLKCDINDSEKIKAILKNHTFEAIVDFLAFSSGDKFHEQMIALCIDSEQDFIVRDILKRDLRQIADVWDSTPDDKKHTLDYPPEISDSITLQLWQKHMRPREEIERDRVDLTPEEESELVKRLTELTKTKPPQ